MGESTNQRGRRVLSDHIAGASAREEVVDRACCPLVEEEAADSPLARRHCADWCLATVVAADLNALARHQLRGKNFGRKKRDP
jgi:hypothetical protein